MTSPPPACTASPQVVYVAVPMPLHVGLNHAAQGVLSYLAPPASPASGDATAPSALLPGTLVRVPLGARQLLGVVWDAPVPTPKLPDGVQLRTVDDVLHSLPPLDAAWRRLVRFTARYYQRTLGEITSTALPPSLRKLTAAQMARRLKPARAPSASGLARRKATKSLALDTILPPNEATPLTDVLPAAANAPVLTAEQNAALHAIVQGGSGTFLLHGSTGSGKTEVYLHAVQHVLQHHGSAQALVLVPEINLTPQLQQRFAARFTPLFGPQAVAVLHSGLTDAQRLRNWLAAHTGQARIVLGTRMAVMASLPQLRILIVDEEHDPSYKQDDGARYHARDLAIWRAHDLAIPIVLGSATPSLESWHASEAATGRYRRLRMPARIGHAALPSVRTVDMRQQPHGTVIAPPLLAAIAERVQRGEQCLLLLNRRGFAPVLFCPDCGWRSDCPHCSAHQVFHKMGRVLRCHHCGDTRPVPRSCPHCNGNAILPLGLGTQQVHEAITHAMAPLRRPDGHSVRTLRMDADTTHAAGSLHAQLQAVHAGDVDVLVGTQMIAKGHDFRRITLVAAIQPDSALFSSDFRAPERLFALLMQAAGRAGRDADYLTTQGSQSEMWLQTHTPDHALYAALRQHSFETFAAQQLSERAQAGLPPFIHQALLRADAPSQQAAQAFLHAAVQTAHAQGLTGSAILSIADAPSHGGSPCGDEVFITPPIPHPMARVADVERAHVLIESTNRRTLQRFLHVWQPWLHWLRTQPEHKPLLRWLLDVDPQTM